MVVGTRRYQCYVCRKRYKPDDLGRVALPLHVRKDQLAWMQVVCKTCYAALCDSWTWPVRKPPPTYHGF